MVENPNKKFRRGCEWMRVLKLLCYLRNLERDMILWCDNLTTRRIYHHLRFSTVQRTLRLAIDAGNLGRRNVLLTLMISKTMQGIGLFAVSDDNIYTWL